MIDPVRKILRLCLLTEVAERRKVLPWSEASFTPTDGVALTGRRFSAWAGLLGADNRFREQSTGRAPVAEALLLESVHRALAAGSNTPALRTGLIDVAATALALAEQLSVMDPDTMPARTGYHVDQTRYAEETAALATAGPTFAESMEAMLANSPTLSGAPVQPMTLDAGMTPGELLKTPKSAVYCASFGCGHGANVHGPFCFARGCFCLQWVWPHHG